MIVSWKGEKVSEKNVVYEIKKTCKSCLDLDYPALVTDTGYICLRCSQDKQFTSAYPEAFKNLAKCSVENSRLYRFLLNHLEFCKDEYYMNRVEQKPIFKEPLNWNELVNRIEYSNLPHKYSEYFIKITLERIQHNFPGIIDSVDDRYQYAKDFDRRFKTNFRDGGDQDVA